MLANMACSLIKHEQIKTTLPKAKELRPYVERLVTVAKRNGKSLHGRRQLIAQIKTKSRSPRSSTRWRRAMPRVRGGYIRVLKAGIRFGDAAPVAFVEFVDRDVTAKGKDSGRSRPRKRQKPEPRRTASNEAGPGFPRPLPFWL